MASTESEELFVQHSFQEQICDSTIFFQTLRMKDSLFLWIGDSGRLDFLTIATPTNMSEVPCCSVLLGNDLENLQTAMTQRLTKKMKKQIFLSLNVDKPDEHLFNGIEKRITKEYESCPEKF